MMHLIFIDKKESAIRERKLVNIADLEALCTNILHENGMPTTLCTLL